METIYIDHALFVYLLIYTLLIRHNNVFELSSFFGIYLFIFLFDLFIKKNCIYVL